MTDLAIIVPTKGRPENVAKVIAAWDFTNAWDHADLVLAVDGDDPAIHAYRALAADFKDRAAEVGIDSPMYLVEHETWLPMVHKLDITARILAERYWALGFAGDDHLPRTIGWAPAYLDALRELRTGLVYGDDGYQGAKLSTEWAMTSDVVRALGRMVPAPVEHMYSDVSVLDLFTAAGAITHLPHVQIEHMHPIAGKAESDAQYQRVNHRDQFRSDKIIYERWREVEMAGHIELVRALWPDRPAPPPAPERRNRARPARTHTTTRGWGPERVRSGPRRPRDVSIVPERNHVRRSKLAPKEFRKVRGATPDEIGVTLADFAVGVPADQAIVELGVFQGRTALLLAWGARQGNGAHVYGFDAWDLPGNTYGPPFNDKGSYAWAQWNVQATGYTGRVTLTRAFAHDAALSWAGPPVGLLFIDDDHSYEGAQRAVLDWAPHLAPDAVIAVDDYHHPDWPGVAEAIDDLVTNGVLEPVQVFHERLAVTKLTETGRRAMRPAHIDPEPTRAITSEGVLPPPLPEGMAGAIANSLGKPAVEQLSTPERERLYVHTDEAEVTEAEAGTPIERLNVAHLRELAKHRGIVLGVRTDKRAEIIQALQDGT